MRNLIVASLVLSPLMLHAQAATNAPVLQSKLNQPKQMLLSGAADRATAPSSAVRVSTGVIAPKLIHTVAIESDSQASFNIVSAERKVVVDMVVDASGKPTELKIVKSAGETMDQKVLAAVSQYRFAPGTVSSQPTAVPVNLEINIQGR